MFRRFRTRRSAVTFDVGMAGVRAHQLRAAGTGFAPCDALEVDLSPPERTEPEAPPVMDVSRLARLVRQASFAGRDVAMVLSPPEAHLSTVRLPDQVLATEDQRILQALKWEIARDTRVDPADLEVRYCRMPPGHYQGHNVLAFAIRTSQARDWYDRFSRHQLHLRYITISPQALSRLAAQSWASHEKDLWAVLDLGFRRATFTAVVGRAPAYVRSLAVSSDGWTRRLAAGLDVSGAVAERLKREHGILPESRGVRGMSSGWQSIRPEDLPCVLFGLLRGDLDHLTQEINKCFSYMLRSFPDLSINRLFLCGGGANLVGLSEFLAVQLGITVSTLHGSGDDRPSGDRCILSGVRFRPEAATAVGGALLDLEAS